MSGPVAESKAIAEKLQQLEDDHKTGVLQQTRSGNFLPPAVYHERDERDDYYQAKLRVAQDARNKESPAFGTEVLVTDKDIKYLMDQRPKQELYEFDMWAYETFNPGADPNKLALFREIHPGWFERREAQIRKTVSIAKSLAKLGLYGPRTQEELYLMYALDQKIVEPPDLDLLFPERAKVKKDLIKRRTEKTSLQQGYWNPRKFTINREFSNRKLASNVQPFISKASPGGSGDQMPVENGFQGDATNIYNEFMKKASGK